MPRLSIITKGGSITSMDSNAPYSEKDYEKAKAQGLDLEIVLNPRIDGVVVV
jgi:hypothetical protein